MLLAFGSNAQTTVSGTVFDQKTTESLTGVSISVLGSVSGTVSDLNGTFKLKSNAKTPFTLVFSYVGYRMLEMEIIDDVSNVSVSLSEEASVLNTIVVSASRIEEKILESPVTIEKLDLLGIKNASAADPYDDLMRLKGVTAVQGSMTFTSLNTRGFARANNERFVQLIDGVDNAAPLLNFSMGNVVGLSELDMRNMELVPGAASALYGPNAFNGILMMNSKSPFEYQGLSVQTKLGISDSDAQDGSEPYYSLSARYAKSFLDDKLAFKINASYLTATDWVANDYNTGRIASTITDPSYPGDPDFDGMNLYGDETQIFVPMVAVARPIAEVLAPIFAQQLNIPVENAKILLENEIPKLPSLDIRRTGFKEEDLLKNNDAKSFKVDGALHYRISEDFEISYAYRFGKGSTVYQGGERYVLDDFTFKTQKLELVNPNFIFRAYITQTDAGDSYNLSALGGFANERFSLSEAQWVPTYAANYAGALLPAHLGGEEITNGLLEQAHILSRAEADKGIPTPGSPEFEAVMESTRADYFQRNPPGAGFVDDSRLYHSEFNYDFSNILDGIGLQVGGNFRRYDLFSDGTVFNEDPEGDGKNDRITIDEYGIYTQLSKKLVDDRLRFTGSIRYDKNENFKGRFSPRLSVVYSGGENKNHNLRASYQTGFRNPSTQQQYIFFPQSSGTLVGSTEENAARYGIHNGGAYTNESYNLFISSVLMGQPNPSLLEIINVPYVKPEKIQVFEVGYKGLINDKLFVDVNAYHNIYDDFMSQKTVRGAQGTTHQGQYLPGVEDVLEGKATTATAYRLYTNSTGQVTSTGIGIGLDLALPKKFHVFGNYNYTTFDVSNTEPDFEAAFNMPENIFLVGLRNYEVIKNLGFDIHYRWQDEFFWQNSFAYDTMPSYGSLNANLNYSFKKVNTTLKVGGTNLFGKDYRTNAGGPFVGTLIYVSLTYDQFMN